MALEHLAHGLCRHLLQELTVPSYIANDTTLCGGSGAGTEMHYPKGHEDPVDDSDGTLTTTWNFGPSMLILTGPNFSGKSVYLKQVALIVYMAHIGCFVPARRATVGLTDKILTRIATKETVSKAQSAFMIDLQQIAAAVGQATHRSLIVIDEFGKGTESHGEQYERHHRNCR